MHAAMFAQRFRFLPLVLAMLQTACSTTSEHIDWLAQTGGLQKHIVVGVPHSLVVYENQAAARTIEQRERLFVYLEGDGSPWGSSGMQPAVDPTARNPLALRLMLQTDDPAIYVARPCYQLTDVRCSAESWTSGRYSEEVVASMARAIASESTRLNARDLIIVGYSGGGPLAVLIAEQLTNIAGVITLGANLDVATWADHHRYLPLDRSLNPATSEHTHPWPEVHISGGKDTVVPTATTDSYFKRFPAAQQIAVDAADHVCCWEAQWPALLASALLQINARR